MDLTQTELAEIDLLITQLVVEHPSPFTSEAEVPAWSSDASLAFALVEYLRSQGLYVKIESIGEGWQVSLFHGSGTVVENTAYAVNFSAAVSLAALFSVGINPLNFRK